jgi:ribosomal-protein-alanine N-acetyltransferase
MTLDEAFSELATLKTPRLTIRPAVLSDAEAIFSFKSIEESTIGFGQEPHRALQQTKAWIERNLEDYRQRGSMLWVLAYGDRVVGSCCYWNFGPGSKCAEIGYELHPDHWGAGIMREALEALIDYGFQDMELHRIEADPLATNERSCNLLLRLGFSREGVLRERVSFRGRFIDQAYFGLLRDDWMGRKR